MPRRNKPVKHTPFQPHNNEAGKKRFANKLEAERAAEYQMLLKPGLELYVYKSDLDGGWYLTRTEPRDYPSLQHKDNK